MVCVNSKDFCSALRSGAQGVATRVPTWAQIQQHVGESAASWAQQPGTALVTQPSNSWQVTSSSLAGLLRKPHASWSPGTSASPPLGPFPLQLLPGLRAVDLPAPGCGQKWKGHPGGSPSTLDGGTRQGCRSYRITAALNAFTAPVRSQDSQQPGSGGRKGGT